MNGGGGAVFQSLLHDSLLATAHVESCALFRKKDGSVKAASAGYQVWKLLGLQIMKISPGDVGTACSWSFSDNP